ncbi:MAG: hypothetical protein WAW96_09185 [Alphaproteobacteria bacterium]
MTSAVTRFASNVSTNTVNFGFPYGGPQHATLTLRSHPRYGKSILLSVEKGQFICGIESCSVSVRFDDGKAKDYPPVPLHDLVHELSDLAAGDVADGPVAEPVKRPIDVRPVASLIALRPSSVARRRRMLSRLALRRASRLWLVIGLGIDCSVQRTVTSTARSSASAGEKRRVRSNMSWFLLSGSPECAMIGG